jgi:hypothetical protein
MLSKLEIHIEIFERKIYNKSMNTDGMSAEKGMYPHSYNTR